MPTCKTLVSALLCAFCAILFASSLEGGGVMRNLAIRGAMMGASGVVPTARDYERRDMLVAQWDGPENTGFGTHDSASRYWIDLTGNGYDLDLRYNPYTRGSFGPDALVCGAGSGCQAFGNKALPQNANYHFEACIDFGAEIRNINSFYPILDGGGSAWIQSASGYKARTFWAIMNQSAYNRNGPAISTPSEILTKTTNWGSYVLPAKMSVSQNISSAYINMVSIPMSATGDFFATAYSKYVTIGGSSASVDGFPASNWSTVFKSGAKIHSIRIYSGHLTQAEIEANFEIDKARFGLP